MLTYNLSDSRYLRILEFQKDCCYICEKEFGNSRATVPHVDHDHKCCAGRSSCGKCIRGLLCLKCNNMLGMVSDDAAILAKAIEYLGGRRVGEFEN